jgi:hypothetical protein
MPTNDLDTLIAHLKAPGTILTDIDAKTLAAGLEDLRNRMAHVEHTSLRTLANSRLHDDHLKQIDDNVAGITNDRDEFRRQVKVATDLPLANQKKVEELEARVRSCEGAVGAAPYKPPVAVKPIEPIKVEEPVKVEDKPLKPVVEPAHGMSLNPFKKAPDPDPVYTG